MKIIESQSAVLSNFEVYQHVTEQRTRYKKVKRRGPPNLETVIREVSFLSTTHNIGHKPVSDTALSSCYNTSAQTQTPSANSPSPIRRDASRSCSSGCGLTSSPRARWS